MNIKTIRTAFILFIVSVSMTANGQKKDLAAESRQAMLRATQFMVDRVSTNGGYLRLYLPDFSRRWAEQEAYPSQIQLTYGKTPEMGHMFLDAYATTGDEYYYQAAEKVARALIWGQLKEGGWDYIVDFAGTSSLKEWYRTIGKNAWGWDEYNHYYGTPTFKNGVTVESARFLLRIYLEKLDPEMKPALDKAIVFILESQYPLGGWPQRYPTRNQFAYGNNRDYTSFYIFNDELTWENIEFLIQCYVTLGEDRLLDPIRRGMNFSLITQQGNPQAGWAEQYDMELKPAHGRKYEPAALMPLQTYRQVVQLMKCYRYTGDRKFIARIPDAIKWLEDSRLPADKTVGGKYTHAVFMEVGTNKPLYAHRKGNGFTDGKYWVDYNDDNPLLHYGAKLKLNIDFLKEEYQKMDKMTPEEATKDSPLITRANVKLEKYFVPNNSTKVPEEQLVQQVIKSLDNQHRWLSKHEWVSRPYAVSETGEETNTAPFSTEGGAAIKDPSDQEYISTDVYLANMKILNGYISSLKRDERKNTGR
jgi:PelA/Pel-15E family pectate lyase